LGYITTTNADKVSCRTGYH